MIKLNNLTVAYNDNTVISDLTYEFAKGNTAITGSSESVRLLLSMQSFHSFHIKGL